MEWFLYQHHAEEPVVSIDKKLFAIGRSTESDHLLKSDKVSRRHAYLHLLTDRKLLYVQDLKSFNGTFVNGKKIEPSLLQELKNKDQLSFGLEARDQATNDADKLVFFRVYSESNKRSHVTRAGSCDSDVSLQTVGKPDLSTQMAPLASCSGIATSTGIDGSAADARVVKQYITITSSSESGSEAEHPLKHKSAVTSTTDPLFKIPVTPKQEPKEEIKSEGEIDELSIEQVLSNQSNSPQPVVPSNQLTYTMDARLNSPEPNTSGNSEKSGKTKRKQSTGNGKSPSKKKRYSLTSSEERNNDSRNGGKDRSTDTIKSDNTLRRDRDTSSSSRERVDILNEGVSDSPKRKRPKSRGSFANRSNSFDSDDMSHISKEKNLVHTPRKFASKRRLEDVSNVGDTNTVTEPDASKEQPGGGEKVQNKPKKSLETNTISEQYKGIEKSIASEKVKKPRKSSDNQDLGKPGISKTVQNKPRESLDPEQDKGKPCSSEKDQNNPRGSLDTVQDIIKDKPVTGKKVQNKPRKSLENKSEQDLGKDKPVTSEKVRNKPRKSLDANTADFEKVTKSDRKDKTEVNKVCNTIEEKQTKGSEKSEDKNQKDATSKDRKRRSNHSHRHHSSDGKTDKNKARKASRERQAKKGSSSVNGDENNGKEVPLATSEPQPSSSTSKITSQVPCCSGEMKMPELIPQQKNIPFEPKISSTDNTSPVLVLEEGNGGLLGFEEPNDRNKGEEVIEITSSDDEDLFSSSQLVNVFDKRPIKNDPIKMEMEALMGQDAYTLNEAIALDEENYGFDNTQQICDILEEGAPPLTTSRFQTYKDPELMEFFTTGTNRVEVIYDVTTSRSNSDEVSTSRLMEAIELNTTQLSNGTERSTTKEVHNRESATNEEVHNQAATLQTNALTSNWQKKRSALKRCASETSCLRKKRSPEEVPIDKKRSKIPWGNKILHTSKSLDKSTKDSIKEVRRQKLKDLAEKISKEAPKEKKKGTAPKIMPESKTFRGAFLLEEGEPSRPKTPKKLTRSDSATPQSYMTRSKSMVFEDGLEGAFSSILTTGSAKGDLGLNSEHSERKSTPKKILSRRKSTSVIEQPKKPKCPAKKFTRSKSVCRQSSSEDESDVISYYGLRSRSRTPVDELNNSVRSRSGSPILLADGTVAKRGRGRPPGTGYEPRAARSRSRMTGTRSRSGSPTELVAGTVVKRGRAPGARNDPRTARSRSSMRIRSQNFNQPDQPNLPVNLPVGKPNQGERFGTPLVDLNDSLESHVRYNFRDRPNTPILRNRFSFDENIQNSKARPSRTNDEDILLSQSYNPSLMYGADPNKPATMERVTVLEMRRINIDDIIFSMVSWQPKWFEEAEANLPLTSATKRVSLNFDNMVDYEETFVPLMLREIWQHCYQSQQPGRSNNETTRAAQIEHFRINGSIITIDCMCYASDADYKRNLLCKFEDFVFCEHHYKARQPDGSMKKTVSLCFAYVSRVNRRIIKDTDQIKRKLASYCQSPDWLVDYTLHILYRSGKEPIANSIIMLKPLMNVSGFLKMIKVVKNLRQSPLCARILKPKIVNYKVAATQTQLVCPLLGDGLNEEQLQAVLESASLCTGHKPGIYSIMGPPGTGKTTVIVNLVMQILFGHGSKEVDHRNVVNEPRILLVAPSNTAVDNLLMKLVDAKNKLGPNFNKNDIKQIRIGPENSINPHVQKYSLQNLVNENLQHTVRQHPKYQQACHENRLNLLVREVYGTRFEMESRKQQDLLLRNSNIVCTTLNSCVAQKIADLVYRNMLRFSCCIIDEATQCHEVESLLPTLLGVDKFVLVGDPKQLHATILSRDSQNLGFDQSLFSRIANNFNGDPRSPIRMLTTQYRMHEEICQFPNKAFYEGKLRSEPRIAHKIPSNIRPYLVFNITRKPSESSEPYVNIDEVHVIKMMLTTLIQMIDLSQTYTIGIIAPYNNQKNLINKNIAELRLNPNIKITVNTVDSFQGMENDIVIISCVRDSSNSFLQNANRLNVALTRAKQALYIIGNYSLFKECKTLYDLREDAKRRKLLLDIKQDPSTITNFRNYIVKR